MKSEYLKNSDQDFGHNLFYQSNSWIKISELESVTCYRLLISDNNNPILYSSIFEYSVPYLGKYFFIPKGPVILSENINDSHFNRFYIEIKNLAKKNKANFCIIETNEELTSNKITPFFKKYSVSFPKNKLPLKTHILDLTLGKEKLLSNLKSKTRYNINLASKKGVKVEFFEINSPDFKKNFDQFYKLLEITGKRGSFGIHNKQHYLNILKEKSLNFQTFLAIAKLQDKILAGNIMLNTQNQSIYLHGASDNNNRNLMAPYLLQWSCIEKALEDKKEIYDFWGISDEKDSWSGLTRFKRSFKGKDIEYKSPKAIVFNPIIFYIYKLYKVMK